MNNGKKQEKAGFRERLCHSLDISPDIFPNGTLVELRGRNSLTVTGRAKIIGYTDEEISLRLSDCCLHVRGRRLCCSSYDSRATVIDGCVTGIELTEEGGI